MADGTGIVERLASLKVIAKMRGDAQGSSFAGEMGALAHSNVFLSLWGRPGLDAKSRSLVTLGILIALRAHDELRVHIPLAVANGCTVEEVEEVIYHASGYAGFPAANSARVTAIEALRGEGLIA
ncbi:carboxymuconolactone decarboxylase family protein [Sphingomonas montanisoli]|uniref:Carboxymuconolactone decarboxylase family protein n=1 Tax=Sphingomonas montanisoli TaxID=2606412 RepID=A0A5D9C7A6_9SPHN|nr:carboxymuconolactone decarboxylase family protein [Sphingomonas montanisoli]TZG25925.1 carboxymuconolactone decarboxylase family protein [Sphingomonas montanisoli]